jgi:hypothetical protein
MITVEEFYESLREELKSTAGIDGASIESEFLRYALDRLVEFGDINSYELVEDGRDSADRWRIDAFSIDDQSDLATGTISLFVSMFDQADVPSNLIRTDLDKSLKKLKSYVEYALEKDIYSFFEPGSGPFEIAQTLKEHWKVSESPKVRFFVVSNRPVSKRITDISNVEIHEVSVEVAVWDLNRFFQVELSVTEREDLEIDLSETPINALSATSTEDGTTKSFLAVMPASILVSIYGKWSGRLLEQNVRSFLSTKVTVNKGMRETIKSAPDKFFAFNNGITATAEDAKFVNSADGLYLTYLKNFQIVNGGQTTASLYSAAIRDKFDVSKIYVQMKLTIVSPDEANELIPYISRYANSQNKVSEADLFSNHPFHRRFEEFSRRIVAPPKPGSVIGTKWYYERARGQYLNDQAYKTEAERRKFQALNPRDQTLSKTDLAKYINTFDATPHIVSRGAQFNFSKFAEKVAEAWGQSDTNISEGYFRAAVAKAIFFKRMEKLVQTQKDSWFNGHRANIVTYTLSLIANKAKLEKKAINYELIWKMQSVPAAIESYLLEMAKDVNDLLKDEKRPVGNIDSYAKTEGFWLSAKNVCQVDLMRLGEVLVEQAEVLEQKKDDKKLQKLTTSLQDEITVRSVSRDKWTDIKKYLEDNHLENPSKLSLIARAQLNPLKLTEKECQFLFVILDEFESYYRE